MVAAMSGDRDDAELNEFVRRYRAGQTSGSVQPLTTYLALFPGIDS